MIPSKEAFTNLNFVPRTPARAAPRSGSTPMIVLLSVSKNSIGAYDASVATTTKPLSWTDLGSMACRAASAPPEALGLLLDELPDPELPPHAVASRATAASAAPILAPVLARRRDGSRIVV